MKWQILEQTGIPAIPVVSFPIPRAIVEERRDPPHVPLATTARPVFRHIALRLHAGGGEVTAFPKDEI
jgi:hypothetical protein